MVTEVTQLWLVLFGFVVVGVAVSVIVSVLFLVRFLFVFSVPYLPDYVLRSYRLSKVKNCQCFVMLLSAINGKKLAKILSVLCLFRGSIFKDIGSRHFDLFDSR